MTCGSMSWQGIRRDGVGAGGLAELCRGGDVTKLERMTVIMTQSTQVSVKNKSNFALLSLSSGK